MPLLRQCPADVFAYEFKWILRPPGQRFASIATEPGDAFGYLEMLSILAGHR